MTGFLLLLLAIAPVVLYVFWINSKLKMTVTRLYIAESELADTKEKLQSQIDEEISKKLATENVFTSFFEHSNEGILMLSVTGRFTMCNTAGAHILGYETGELVGRALFEISPVMQPYIGKTSFDAIEEVFEHVLLDNKYRFEWCCLSKSGTEIMLEVVLFMLNRSGRQEIFMMWRDITELKRLQKEKEANQAILIQQTKLAELGSMIGVISHQWKQPINTISLLSQSLEDDFEDGDLDATAMHDFSQGIKKQIEFMTQTMDDFRDFYKPSKELVSFGVSKVVKSVLSLLEGQLVKDRVKVHGEYDESAKSIGYPSEFKQVILNILNNACDAFESKQIKNRQIAIHTKLEGPGIVLKISDNAGGIPESIITTLFDPFVSTKGDKGTGIGLSLSKTIVEKMGGNISVQNIEDGAEFTIQLKTHSS